MLAVERGEGLRRGCATLVYGEVAEHVVWCSAARHGERGAEGGAVGEEDDRAGR